MAFFSRYGISDTISLVISSKFPFHTNITEKCISITAVQYRVMAEKCWQIKSKLNLGAENICFR